MASLNPRGRILVVEDEMLIALLIEDALDELSYDVVGPAGRLENAIKLAREEVFSAAILDVNIRGGDTTAVAEILKQRAIPFVLASGYGDWAMPDVFKGQALLSKPFTVAELRQAITTLLPQA